MVAPFGGFLSGFFPPWLLLLLSSIFNFPINQSVVLFPSLFLAGVRSRGCGLLPPGASARREGLGGAREFSPFQMGQGLEGTVLGSHPRLIHSFTWYIFTEQILACLVLGM